MLIKSLCHLPFELSNCQGGLQCNVLSHLLPHGFHLLLHRLARFSSPTRNGRRARVAAPAPSFGWACPDGSFAMVIFEKQRTLFFLEEKVNITKKHAWAMSQELGPCRSFCIRPLLFVSPKHSNGFRLSSLQILVSKFDGTFHIHDSHSSNNCGHIPESHRSLNSKHCCDDDPMILPFSEWSSIFHPKKAQVLHVLLGFVERPQNSNMALFCETKGLVAHNTKADVL